MVSEMFVFLCENLVQRYECEMSEDGCNTTGHS